MWYDNEITQSILHKKYLHEGEKDIHDLINRVSSIYSDNIREDVKQALYNGDFCPAGRTIYAAGMKGSGVNLSLSNCYCCTTPEDSLESISAVDYEMSKIGSMGGGVGVALDKIRPKGSKINNSAKVSEGVSFCLHKFNTTGESIGQNSRHMAMMVMLDCKHPDIYEFLHIKEKNEKLSAMNITIKMSDDFLGAVEKDDTFDLYFKVESTGEEIKRTIRAREFFREFCDVNRDYGDPGICYIDRVRSYHLLSGYDEYIIDTSNPCSEFFGIAGNACNLGSINLYNIVLNKFTDEAKIDYDKFENLIRLGIRCLDETLDYGYDMQPMNMHRKCIDDWRSIGLGVFGLGDLFVAMKVKYGSKESFSIISDVFDFMNRVALDESCNIAKEKGTFGKYEWGKINKSPIIQALRLDKAGIELYDKIEKYGLRNGTLLVIAPTGTLSLFMGKLSGGVEPLFKCGYDRTTHAGEDKGVVFRVFSRSIEDLLTYSSLPLTLTNEEIKKKFDWVVESEDIEPLNRILVQSLMQTYVDGAISSTINLPEGTTSDVIYDIYMKAWKQGLKGITVFVNNCKRGNILGVDKNNDSQSFKYDSIEPVSRRGVKEVEGRTIRLKTACVDKFYITINHTDDGELFEVFANPSGGCQANITTMCRLVSMALRSGVKVEEIAKELKAMKCPACQALRRKGEANIELSCGNAIAKALEMSYNKESKTVVEETPISNSSEDGLYECPECGKKTLRLEAKCVICSNCAYSRCE